MDRDRAIDALVRFARVVSDAAASGEILPILADAIRDNVGTDGVCVVEVEKKVFEPFFTTKGTEGTGLGLAIVYATVQRCGGNITLDTALGRGTRFRLWFPAAAP